LPQNIILDDEETYITNGDEAEVEVDEMLGRKKN
jgi:hypothetical protein